MTTYAEYVARGKNQKHNPDLIAPKTAKLPSKARGFISKKIEQPPLDMGYHKTENGKYNFKKVVSK